MSIKKKILYATLGVVTAAVVGGGVYMSNIADAKYTGPTMTMEDGTELVTFLYLPEGEGPFPTLIFRTVYDLPLIPLGGMDHVDYTNVKDADLGDVGWPELTAAGYAFVVQHTRGRIGSEGETLNPHDREDGLETIAWIRSQPWSDGRVGTFGDSAGANLSLLMNAENPEGLEASFIQAGSPSLLNDSVFGPGGAMKLELFLPWIAEQAAMADDHHYDAIGLGGFRGFVARMKSLAVTARLLATVETPQDSSLWSHMPLIDYPALPASIPAWNDLLGNGYQSEYFEYWDTSSSEVPTYHSSLWFDVFATSQLNAFELGELEGKEQRLLILNGTHYDVDDPGIWPIQPLLPWLDAKFGGDTTELDKLPRIAFTMANIKDEWYEATTWPPAVSDVQTWDLSADGSISAPTNSVPASAVTGSLSFTYDPQNPVPTIGGRNLLISDGPMDQTPVRAPFRDDVLSYSSDTLEEDLNVIGHIYGNLTVSSDSPDTDFTMKLLDLSPSGEATLVAEGILRMRYRGGHGTEELMQPGETYDVEIDLGHIAWRFEEGHKFAIDVSSSNFPQWDRNPNSSAPLYTTAETQVAVNSVIHGVNASSSILLPVVEDLGQLTALPSYTTNPRPENYEE